MKKPRLENWEVLRDKQMTRNATKCAMCRDGMRFVRWFQAGRGYVHLDRYRADSGPECGAEPLCKAEAHP